MKDGDSSAENGDAAALFRDATRDVKRLRPKAAPPTAPRPRPQAAFTRADQQAVLQESLESAADPALLETGDEIAFKRNGVPDTTLRKLRRGHYAVDAEIDLHGLTAPQARAALREFLSAQIHRGSRCVRIVHGKGLRSGSRGPVLKNIVNRDLRRIAAIVAFGSARQVDGGGGAVYALLNAPLR